MATYQGLEGGGTVYLYGTATGLTDERSWYGETVGASMTAGDFDRDGYGDFAFGQAYDKTVQSGEPWQPQYPVAQRLDDMIRALYGNPQGLAATRMPADMSQERPGQAPARPNPSGVTASAGPCPPQTSTPSSATDASSATVQ